MRSGREAIKLDHIHKAYGDLFVYNELNGLVLRGDRIAIVGVNGAGKTTLLKMVAGEIPPDSGEVALGHNVTVGYYAQHHTDRLNPAHTVLEEIAALAPDKPQSWVRGVLGTFLFSGDDVDKPISALKAASVPASPSRGYSFSRRTCC